MTAEQTKLLERVRAEGVLWAKSISERQYHLRSRLVNMANAGLIERHDAGSGKGIYYTMPGVKVETE